MAKKKKVVEKDEKRFRPYGKHEIENPSVEGSKTVETGVGIKRGKGKRNNGNRDIATHPRYRGTNDVRWYASNDQLLRDVAQLSFANPSGVDIAYAIADGLYKNTPGDLTERMPGIMTIDCIPTYGISSGPESPLNQGAQLLYNTIRAENSGARNYDAPDLMHYIMGVDSLFIYYAMLLRLYGTINHFTFLNRYSPRALVFAMGFDYDDIVNNMAQLRSYINTYAKRLSSYIMPHDITVIERHFNMFGRVYKDSESPKSQFYMYVPSVIWRYNPVGTQTGAALEPLTIQPSSQLASTYAGHKFTDIVTIGDQLLAYMNDEDTLTMAGDMLKAFGEQRIWKQEYIDYDFSLEPVFDFTWLTQVQNLNSLDFNISNNTMGTVATTCPYEINEVIPTAPISPYLETKCRTVTNHPKLAHSKLLLSPYDSPSPYDVMESSRLTLHVDSTYISADQKWRNDVISCGAEIVNQVHIVNFMNTATGVTCNRLPVVLDSVDAATATVNFFDTRLKMSKLDAFAMHPTKYFISNTGPHSQLNHYQIEMPFADLDNWSILHNSTIDALHKVALLSMLYVRNVGFYARY